MDWIENIYAVIFRPKEGFKKLTDRRYLNSSLWILFLISAIFALNTASELYFSLPKSILFVFIIFISISIIWIVMSIVITFIADLLKGTGRTTDTMIGWAYAHVPLIFIAPLTTLPNIIGKPGMTLKIIMTMLIFCWVCYLIILALSIIHRFTIRRSVYILILSVFLIFSSGIFIFTTLFALGAMLITSL